VAGDDAVARDQLIGHAEIETAVDDESVELFEAARIEQQLHPFAGGELARGVLAAKTLVPAAQLGAAIQIAERIVGVQAFTACAFSQSFRNFSRPIDVSG
jgi:hypothetical protein